MNTGRGRVPAERLHMTPSFILPGDPDCNDFSNDTVVGRDGAVGIATHYGLNRPAIEFRWGRDFSHPFRPTLGRTQPPIQWVPFKSAGAWRWSTTPSTAEVKKSVELYFYSPLRAFLACYRVKFTFIFNFPIPLRILLWNNLLMECCGMHIPQQ